MEKPTEILFECPLVNCVHYQKYPQDFFNEKNKCLICRHNFYGRNLSFYDEKITIKGDLIKDFKDLILFAEKLDIHTVKVDKDEILSLLNKIFKYLIQ